MICRGKNRYVDELHFRDPGHNPTSSELLLERSIAKGIEPCSTDRGDPQQAEIKKLVMKKVRQKDPDINEKLTAHFRRPEGKFFSDTDWLQHIS